jgi:hypothetical protein
LEEYHQLLCTFFFGLLLTFRLLLVRDFKELIFLIYFKFVE